MIEVLLVPLIVTVSGMLWSQLCYFAPPADQTKRGDPALATPFVALLVVLVLFQIVLRPGIRFY